MAAATSFKASWDEAADEICEQKSRERAGCNHKKEEKALLEASGAAMELQLRSRALAQLAKLALGD